MFQHASKQALKPDTQLSASILTRCFLRYLLEWLVIDVDYKNTPSLWRQRSYYPFVLIFKFSLGLEPQITEIPNPLIKACGMQVGLVETYGTS
jgi:hypothetical protein